MKCCSARFQSRYPQGFLGTSLPDCLGGCGSLDLFHMKPHNINASTMPFSNRACRNLLVLTQPTASTLEQQNMVHGNLFTVLFWDRFPNPNWASKVRPPMMGGRTFGADFGLGNQSQNGLEKMGKRTSNPDITEAASEATSWLASAAADILIVAMCNRLHSIHDTV